MFQDTDPPVTTITSSPPPVAVTRGPTSATFAFAGSENFVTFQCRLDGGGFAPCASPVTFGNLGEGEHVFSVRAIDAAGNVEAAPPAATWLIAFDRDGDGFTRFSNPPDCNDGDPTVFPGAPESRGGHIDSDCDGTIDPFLRIRPNISFLIRPGSKFSEFTQFVVSSVPTGARVDLSCAGKRRCPFHQRSTTPPRGSHRVSFTRLLKNRHLPVGLVLVVRITAPQSIGGFESLTIRSSKLPRAVIQCMNPGTRRPHADCPAFSG
jgi:hypothetical protein